MKRHLLLFSVALLMLVGAVSQAGLINVSSSPVVASGGNTPSASRYSLELLSQRPAGTSPTGIESNNRIFKAYPGLVQEFPLAAIGGSYPYTYEVSGGEAGKFSVVSYTRANGSTGYLLRYTNPQPTDDTTDITITVTDAVSATDSSTYSITVGTSPFRFMDAVNGSDSCDGTSPTVVSATVCPWQTISHMWSAGRADQIIYFRTGVYSISATHQYAGAVYSGTLGGTHSSTTADLGANAPPASPSIVGWVVWFPDDDFLREITAYDSGTGVITFTPSTGVTLTDGDNWRVGPSFHANFDGDGNGGLGRATQWVAYPGDAPEINIQGTTLGMPAPFIKLGNDPNVWLEGFEVYDDWTKAFEVNTASGYGAVIWRNNFHSGGAGSDGSNSAFIMFSEVTPQQYGALIISNRMADSGHNAVKSYGLTKQLIEGNDLSGGNGGIAQKDSVLDFIVRDNLFDNLVDEGATQASAVGGNMNTSDQQTSGEVSYNLFRDPDDLSIEIGRAKIASIGRIDVFRNTSRSSIMIRNLATADGPYNFSKNAIQSPDTGGNWAGFEEDTIGDASRLVRDDNLVGTSGVINADGSLVDASKIGTHGHVIP